MNDKIQLLSQGKASGMEKEALQLLARGGQALLGAARTAVPRLGNLTARKDFIGGLSAPVTKFVGGLQNIYGRGQQGIAALKQGLGSSVDDLLNNPLYQRGAKNVASGRGLREVAGFRSGLKAPNPMGYRAGRLIGGVAIGAPLMSLPFTAAEYAGAASADPELAKSYAKEMAYERAKDRLNQFQSMPFLDRMKAVYNPQSFTQQLEMPEASDLYQSMSSGNTTSPGVLKYLSSFNPFFGSPSDVINQKVRGQMFNDLNPKSANEKQAMSLISKAMPVLRGVGNAFRRGRMATKYDRSFMPRRAVLPGASGEPMWRTALNRAAYGAGKSPLKALGGAAAGAAGLGIAPYFLKSTYDAGRQSVYDAAANNAMGMADLQMLSKFNQPGFMGGLGRAGMAIAPGIGSDMILNQIRQSMFPQVSNPGQ